MRPYSVVLSSRASRDLKKLPPSVIPEVSVALQMLINDPRPVGSLKLVPGEDFRIRIGEYRVVYTIDDALAVVKIKHVGHRRNVYRKK